MSLRRRRIATGKCKVSSLPLYEMCQTAIFSINLMFLIISTNSHSNLDNFHTLNSFLILKGLISYAEFIYLNILQICIFRSRLESEFVEMVRNIEFIENAQFDTFCREVTMTLCVCLSLYVNARVTLISGCLSKSRFINMSS